MRPLTGFWRTLPVLFAGWLFAAHAQSPDPADSVCPRFADGATISNPPELRSRNGVLETSLNFRSATDAQELTRYCYVTDSGLQAPTLRVNPGDVLLIHFRNALNAPTAEATAMHVHAAARDEGCRGPMSPSTTNLHFHGMSIPPTCHQDEALHTAIQPGHAFAYRIRIPADAPPGLYWYHPHPHGFILKQIQGGASGALIVEGAQAINPSLAGLPEHILVLRDQPLPGPRNQPQSPMPAWDLSVNYVPVTYPQYQPATMFVRPAERQFWRVVNAAANTILDLRLIVDGTPQPLQVFAIDGVPISGGPLTRKNIPLGPGARAEFVLQTPAFGETAQLITEKWDTGPAGDSDPQRPLLNIVSRGGVQESTLKAMPRRVLRASDLARTRPTVERELYFAESAMEEEGKAPGSGGPGNDANTRFYLFLGGYDTRPFDMHAPPNLVVHQGTVEDWTITNTTFEDHVFHIHQLHFQVLEINGRPVHDPVLRDTINVPHISVTAPRSSVKLRMDFRGANLVGTFIYQCHIVAHEEGGMVGSIQVLPPGQPTSVELSPSLPNVPLRQPLTVVAKVKPAAKHGLTPTGTVQFSLDGSIDGPPVPVAGGEATRNFSFYGAAVHTIGAIYSGDSGYEASQAQPVRITSTAK